MVSITSDIENYTETHGALDGVAYTIKSSFDETKDVVSQNLVEYAKQVFIQKDATPKNVRALSKNLKEKDVQYLSSFAHIRVQPSQNKNQKELCGGMFYGYEYILPQEAFANVFGVTRSYFSSWALDYKDMKAAPYFIIARYQLEYKYDLNNEPIAIHITGSNLWNSGATIHFWARMSALFNLPASLLGLVFQVHLQGINFFLGKVFTSCKAYDSYFQSGINIYSQDVKWLAAAAIAPETTLKKVAELIKTEKGLPFFKKKEELGDESGFLMLSTENRALTTLS